MITATANRAWQRLGVYFAIVKVTFLEAVAYTAEVVGQIILVGFRLGIFLLLYKTTYSAAGVSDINGTALTQVLWILFFVQAFASLSGINITWMISQEVKEGTIVYALTKPYSFLRAHYASFWGRAGLRAAAFIFLGVTLMPLLVGWPLLSWGGVLAGGIAMVLGVTIDFLMQAMIGLSSFWVEENSGFRWVYGKLVMVFGGMIFPIVLFPDAARAVVSWLPFANLFSGPAELIIHFSYGSALRILLVQLGWVLILMTCTRFIYHRGLRYVALNGG